MKIFTHASAVAFAGRLLLAQFTLSGLFQNTLKAFIAQILQEKLYLFVVGKPTERNFEIFSKFRPPREILRTP